MGNARTLQQLATHTDTHTHLNTYLNLMLQCVTYVCLGYLLIGLVNVSNVI